MIRVAHNLTIAVAIVLALPSAVLALREPQEDVAVSDLKAQLTAGLEEDSDVVALEKAIRSGEIHISEGRNITRRHLAPHLLEVRQAILARNRRAQATITALGENAVWVTPKTAINLIGAPAYAAWPIHNARGHPYQVMMSRTLQTGVVDTKGTGKTKVLDPLGGETPIVVGARRWPGPWSLSSFFWFGAALPASLTEIENGLRWQQFGLAAFGEPLPLSTPIDLIEVRSLKEGDRNVPIKEFLLDVLGRIRNVWSLDDGHGREPYTPEDYRLQLAVALVTVRGAVRYQDQIWPAAQRLATEHSAQKLVEQVLQEVTPVQMRSISPAGPRVSLLEALLGDGAVKGILDLAVQVQGARRPEGDEEFLLEKAIVDRAYREIAAVYEEALTPLPDDRAEVMEAVNRDTWDRVSPASILFSSHLGRYARALYAVNQEAFDRIVMKAAANNAKNLGVLMGVGGYSAESFARRNLIAGGFARDFDNGTLPDPDRTEFDAGAFERETAESLVLIEHGLGTLRYFLTGEKWGLPRKVQDHFKKTLKEAFDRTRKAVMEDPQQKWLSPAYIHEYRAWFRRATGHVEKRGRWYREDEFELQRDSDIPGKRRVGLASVLRDYLNVFVREGTPLPMGRQAVPWHMYEGLTNAEGQRPPEEFVNARLVEPDRPRVVAPMLADVPTEFRVFAHRGVALPAIPGVRVTPLSGDLEGALRTLSAEDATENDLIVLPASVAAAGDPAAWRPGKSRIPIVALSPEALPNLTPSAALPPEEIAKRLTTLAAMARLFDNWILRLGVGEWVTATLDNATYLSVQY